MQNISSNIGHLSEVEGATCRGLEFHVSSSEKKLDHLNPNIYKYDGCVPKKTSYWGDQVKINGFLLSDVLNESGREDSKGEAWVLLSACAPHKISCVSRDWLYLFERLSVTGMRLEEMDWTDPTEDVRMDENESECEVVENEIGEDMEGGDEDKGGYSSSPLIQQLQTKMHMKAQGHFTTNVDFVTKTPSGKTVIAILEMHAVYEEQSGKDIEPSQRLRLTHYLVHASAIMEVSENKNCDVSTKEMGLESTNTASSATNAPTKNSNNVDIFHRIEAAVKTSSIPSSTKLTVEPDTPLSIALEQSVTAELPFALVSAKGKIIHVNDAWQDTFNYSYAEAVDMYIFTLGDHLDSMEATRAMQDISLDLKTRTLLIEGKTKLGSVFSCALQLTPMLATSPCDVPVQLISAIYVPQRM